jgi:hypothetical protein
MGVSLAKDAIVKLSTLLAAPNVASTVTAPVVLFVVID